MKNKYYCNGKINTKLLLFIILIIVIAVVFFLVTKKDDSTNTAELNVTSAEEYNSEVESNNSDEVKQKENIVEEKSEEDTIDLSKLSDSEKLGSEGLPILMYHFFYDKSKGETAKDGNWLEVSIFEQHLQYLEENDFYFPTWSQVADYVEGKTPLPKKSVVLTVDDGDESFFQNALPILEKHKAKMTEFLVTSWNGWYKNDYPSKKVSYQSHSHDMHKAGANGKGAMVNWSYNEILKDLQTSRNELGDECIAYCYPFGHYNDTAKRAVKDAGFRVAFTTEGGRVTKGTDPYLLPRVRTSSSTTLEVFKKLVD
ncbi:MAG: polysaccharide deacetylase family protein [Clostridia bacterium]|nr:polysaccharide deacetylase family protein [Clostridia bacterium]